MNYNEKKKHIRLISSFVILLIVVVLLVFININNGSVKLGVTKIIDIIIRKSKVEGS